MVKVKRMRGKCPYCGHKKALTSEGKVWKHPIQGTDKTCGGSGHYPTAGSG